MQTQTRDQREDGRASAPAAAPAPASLPDVNAETHPFEIVQHLLDQTADFNLFAVPVPHYAEAASLTPRDPGDWFGLNGGYGIALRSRLHRFDSFLLPPLLDRGVRTAQAVGESVGTLDARFFFCPDGFGWAAGKIPPPVLFDPFRAQRFSIVEARFDFDHEDGFRAYGVGRTFPVSVNGCPRVLAGGVGNVTEGTGRMRGLNGTFIFTGTLTRELGFLGQVTARLVDPQGLVRSDRDIPSLTAIADPDPESTFLVMRGLKKDRTVRTTFGPPPGAPGLVSLMTPSQMRAVQYSVTPRGLRTAMRVGPVVATMDANVLFNLLAPPGTAEAPVPFSTEEVYTFVDAKGRPVGTVNAGVVEGISFDLKFPAAPDQKGVRFAGFGPITGGTGACEGAQGMLTVNSLIGIAPHVLSLVHVLHVVDPEGRHRARG